jgi:hypothetical protein
MTTKFTKWSLSTLPNGHEIFQMATKYTDIFLFQGQIRYTQIRFFGMKIYHLATLAAAALNWSLGTSNGLAEKPSFKKRLRSRSLDRR